MMDYHKADNTSIGFVMYDGGVELQSRVPELMQLRGIANAYQLRRLTGLAYATCYQLARGKVPSRANTIAVLANTLDVTPGDLFRQK